MSPWFTALLLLSAGGFFAFTMVRRLAPLRAFRKDERLDRPGERIGGLLRFGFGQKRLVDPEERTGPGSCTSSSSPPSSSWRSGPSRSSASASRPTSTCRCSAPARRSATPTTS